MSVLVRETGPTDFRKEKAMYGDKNDDRNIYSLEQQPFYREEKKWSLRFIIIFVASMLMWMFGLLAVAVFGLTPGLTLLGIVIIAMLMALFVRHR